jgi:3-isopropylmalate dehydrogenase
MLLRYSGGLDCEADDIEQAIQLVLNDGYRTQDIAADGTGQLATTSGIGERVAEAVAEVADVRYAYHAV